MKSFIRRAGTESEIKKVLLNNFTFSSDSPKAMNCLLVNKLLNKNLLSTHAHLKKHRHFSLKRAHKGLQEGLIGTYSSHKDLVRAGQLPLTRQEGLTLHIIDNSTRYLFSHSRKEKSKLNWQLTTV